MKNVTALGIETEYAAHLQSTDNRELRFLFNAVKTPWSVVWDEQPERPWCDARGFISATSVPPFIEFPLQKIEDEAEEGDNYTPVEEVKKPQPIEIQREPSPCLILKNGARFYLDHTHPELCTPECNSPIQVVCYDRAADVWLEKLVTKANSEMEGRDLTIFKNNIDAYGNTYGCHENYSIERSLMKTLFECQSHRLFTVLIPYLVSRQVFCGSGKVAPLAGTGRFDFQISQRADVFETLIGLQTTINRPIINTRDEPHANNQRYGRLHVITSDSNLAEYSTYLKVGTAALVLEMLVQDKLRLDLTLADPLRDMRGISYDPSCRRKVELETDRRRLSAVDIQRYIVEAAYRYLDEIEDNSYRRHICLLWSETLDLLADNPANLSSRLDWVIKYEFLKMQIDKGHLNWESPQIRELDIRYHQLDPNRSLFQMLKKNGFVETLVTEEEVSEAAVRPPTDTRASIRIACLEKFAEQIISVNWDTIVFKTSSGQLFRWRLDDPAPNDCNEIRKKIIKADSMEALVHSILSSQIKDNHYGTQNGL